MCPAALAQQAFGAQVPDRGVAQLGIGSETGLEGCERLSIGLACDQRGHERHVVIASDHGWPSWRMNIFTTTM